MCARPCAASDPPPRTQTQGLTDAFHSADTKTIKRLVDGLLESGGIVAVPDVVVATAKSRLGVRHERQIVVYVAPNKVRAVGMCWLLVLAESL